MPLAPGAKQTLIETTRLHATDTGSPEVQIALMTRRINDLNEHLKVHQHDHHGGQADEQPDGHPPHGPLIDRCREVDGEEDPDDDEDAEQRADDPAAI